MQKENIFLIISIILSIVILIFSIYTFYPSKDTNPTPTTQQDLTQENTDIEQDFQPTTISEQLPEVEYKLLHSAWIPSWDFENGYKSLELNKYLISTVHPVLYGVNNDGTLLDRKPSKDQLNKLLSLCTTNDIEIVPTIGSYDYKILGSVLQSDLYIEKLIGEILIEVDTYEYDGIDIDFEKIYSSEKEGYFKFLTRLKDELDKKNKTLSVTVVAKIRDGKVDTLEVQDWKRIGDIADEVKIMAYDYTLQTSPTPGPIAPMPWIKEVIVYGLERIPKEKISLGIHLYAYLWKAEKASALTYISALNIVNNVKINEEYLKDISEGYAKYTCSDGSTCILYYQTPLGVKERVDIAKENNLRGVTYWRLGSENGILDLVK